MPAAQSAFMERLATATDGDLTVRTGVPSREEAEAVFGTSLYADRIQPVWIEVQNRGAASWVLLQPGIDPHYFSPLEVAYQRHAGDAETRRAMDWFFYREAFHGPVGPGETVSGFVFSNVNEGAKAIQVDLLADHQVKSFTLVVPVPGLVTDVSQVDLANLYPEIANLETESQLRARLAALPCCTTDREGDANGDPLNIVMVGDRSHIFAALVRRDWHQTEVTYSKSAMKTAFSFLFGSRYLYSPISPLYVFGRSQDIGLQKARQSISLRNHMRLWRAPFDFRGRQVYVGQISRDVGVRFSARTITTHAIDPDIDETRDGLVADLAYSQALARIAWVRGAQASTLEDTHYNLSPDPYYSDGLRAVMFFEERPTGLAEIEILDWARHRAGDALR
ncbi:LssY C-terminal domain-containing protein [Pseudohaliea rubra]|uniref:LssY-like C-terminal domain-containing protein n=1 Tax=Pseudohaliea rubra DSM 19751 TaxID=1265313 RepID=A0A095VV04_9GAMM|nr:LssY C-terminal domain-containing protein [Pseudohaliea rubra]KGE05165.1 hypothetical protein HRUBRA_00209 [Pseudohaliea rubra DSM 19751]